MGKSPCVQDCPGRKPCGACRAECEAFQTYEKERLERKPPIKKYATIGYKTMVKNSQRYALRGRRHMR